jgi:nitrogen regulatory protein P-II 1
VPARASGALPPFHGKETPRQLFVQNNSGMKRVEAIIKFFKVEEVKERLFQVGARGISVSEVLGYSRSAVVAEAAAQGVVESGFAARNARIQVVVDDEMVYPVVDAILASARTGEPGDGEIFVSPVSDVYRIRTGERGIDAL